MTNQPPHRPESAQFEELTVDRRADDDDEADDIAAFYAAQEVAFGLHAGALRRPPT